MSGVTSYKRVECGMKNVQRSCLKMQKLRKILSVCGILLVQQTLMYSQGSSRIKFTQGNGEINFKVDLCLKQVLANMFPRTLTNE